jgi:hypothetical protein
MTQIHPDIPEDRAWKYARRIYVRSAYRSKLSDDLYWIGAKWDPQEHCLWVGSGKLEQVIPLIQANEERGTQAAEVKAAGLWAKIPYQASGIRDLAKSLGGKWDSTRKEWAMPTEAALGAVQEKIAEHSAAEKTRKAGARARKAAEAAVTDEEIIARSGRVLAGAGEKITAGGILEGYMKRPQAEASKPRRGDVLRMKDGTRILILSAAVSFWTQDDVDDQAPHEEPGWRWGGTAVRVEPTPEEAARDEAREASRRDGETVAGVIQRLLGGVAGEDAWAGVTRLSEQDARRVPGDAAAGRVTGGSWTLTLTADGRVHYYHPGHYDAWLVTCWETADPRAADLMRAVLGPGSRGAGQYTVTVTDVAPQA